MDASKRKGDFSPSNVRGVSKLPILAELAVMLPHLLLEWSSPVEPARVHLSIRSNESEHPRLKRGVSDFFLFDQQYKLSPECLKFLKGLLCRTEIDRLTAEVINASF